MNNFPEGAALVFGGSGGIGAQICRTLARDGASVVVVSRSNKSHAEEIAKEIVEAGGNAKAVSVDNSSYKDVSALVAEMKAEFGAIHTVVYAAGPTFGMNFISKTDPQEWKRVLDQDANGCFNIVRSSLEALRESKGSIVAVITCALQRAPIADILSAAPKAAIEMLIRGVAKEEARFGVRANCVGPGWINAGIGARAIESKLSDKDVQNILRAIPMGHIGESADIAEAVAFLASSRAKYITGQNISVDGGLTL